MINNQPYFGLTITNKNALTQNEEGTLNRFTQGVPGKLLISPKKSKRKAYFIYKSPDGKKQTFNLIKNDMPAIVEKIIKLYKKHKSN